MMNATTWKDEAVRTALREHTVPLHLDVEQHAAVSRDYQVRAVPTLVLLSPDGKVVHRAEGYFGAGAFLEEFGAALRNNTAAAS